MAVVSRLLPSIPTPTIPKRTRSLAATGESDANSGSAFRSMAFAASVAPAAPAVVCKNSRRENRSFFMNVISLGTAYDGYCLRPILICNSDLGARGYEKKNDGRIQFACHWHPRHEL